MKRRSAASQTAKHLLELLDLLRALLGTQFRQVSAA
jgi:hypothetical protein